MFGLSFLNSLFLWGMAAASIPLIIHLIKRNRAVKLPFAAVRFLQLEPNQKVKSEKLKQLLLLLMRMIALALLAFAFARPFLKGTESTTMWGEEAKAAVILIDNSFSMGYDNRLGKAIDEAKQLLDDFKSGDQVAVMSFAEKAEIVGQVDEKFGSLGGRLSNRIALSQLGTNLVNAVQAAETVLFDSALESKIIYVISDFQKTGISNTFQQWSLQPGVRLTYLNVSGASFSNVAIKEVHIGSEGAGVAKKDLLVRTKNHGTEVKNIVVTLTVAGKEKGTRKVRLQAEEEKIVEFKQVRFPKGLVSGHVTLASAAEEVKDDDTYYFVLETKSAAQLLAVNGEANRRDATKSELFFVERAVNLSNHAKYGLMESSVDDVRKHEFTDYQAVILANVKDLDRATLERLSFYVRGGGGLILALGDQINPTIFNQLFRHLSPAVLTSRAFQSINRDNTVILAEVDYQHPIFRVFSESGYSDPSIAQFYQYLHTEPVQPEAVLASYDDGSPALLERKVGRGKVILFTSTFDTEWNNMPVKAIFLPLLYQAIQYVASEKKGQKSYLVGQPIRLTEFSSAQLEKRQIEVELPSGERLELHEPLLNRTDAPGAYAIKRKGQDRALARFAVNVDSRESDLTPLESEKLQSAFVVESDESVQMASVAPAALPARQEKSQKLWRLIILVVIMLLIGETWLANRTYG